MTRFLICMFIRWWLLLYDVKRLLRRSSLLLLQIRYDAEAIYFADAMYFEEGITLSKKTQLVEKILLLIQPAHQSLLGHIRSRTFGRFKDAFANALKGGKMFKQAACDCTNQFMAQFDEACADADVKQANWDSSEVRNELSRDMNQHISAVSKLSELTTMFEKFFFEALAGTVEVLLDGADDTWPSMRRLLRRETELAVSGFSSALSDFEIDDVTKQNMISRLEDHARGILETKVKEESGRVLLRMKERFTKLFSYDSDSVPRTWTGNEDITAITKRARASALKLLSDMTAIRLDDHADSIEKILSLALLNPRDIGVSGDLLASTRWDKVPQSKTLLTPVQCKSLWTQFQVETEPSVNQAIATRAQAITAQRAQEANIQKNHIKKILAIVAIFVALAGLQIQFPIDALKDLFHH